MRIGVSYARGEMYKGKKKEKERERKKKETTSRVDEMMCRWE